MALRVQLHHVRKRSTGRVHLTVRIPKDAAVHTLCGQTFKPGDYVPTDDDADCRICVRRQSNEAVVSSAFFQEDLGEELLKLSLQQARERRPAAEKREPARKKKPPQLVVVPETQPEAPKVLGELELAGLKRVSESVYLSPAGVIVRLRKARGGWEVEEVAFNGPVQVRRRSEDRIEVRLGDLRAVFSSKGGAIEASYATETED
jgi:hypothetical protein